ncbi:MAG TPA: VOC family protein [Thermomicrobiales bacterium]|nr:VOC family protein [Thermomicrobiales bacterium]
MGARVRPFLMFQGDAEAALTFYVSLFADGQILDLTRYGPGEAGREGSIMRATFAIGGQTIYCIDSPPVHDFTFTPSFSLFVDCASEEELERLVAALSDGGATFMPLGDYGFSRRFAWVADRFGVSWQLNLP